MQPILFLLAGAALNIGSGTRRGVPPSMRGMLPLPAARWTISGVTRDNTGAALGNCIVQLFRTIDDGIVEEVTSDGSGNYVFLTVGLANAYYAVAYKAGTPDVTGATVNTLMGVG